MCGVDESVYGHVSCLYSLSLVTFITPQVAGSHFEQLEVCLKEVNIQLNIKLKLNFQHIKINFISFLKQLYLYLNYTA